MNIQTVENLLYEVEQLPIDERLLLIERLVGNLRLQHQTLITSDDIESACGILQAPQSVSLEQMDEVIRQRGSSM